MFYSHFSLKEPFITDFSFNLAKNDFFMRNIDHSNVMLHLNSLLIGI